MYKVIKLRIYPTKDQINRIENILGTIRFLWNRYLEDNDLQLSKFKNGDSDKSFIGKMEYYKSYYPLLKEKYPWVSENSTKDSRKGIFNDAEKAYKRFFEGKKGHPNFKSKKRSPVRSYYFRKNGIRFDKPRMVWIPDLHYVKFADRGYAKKGILNEKIIISSGRVVKDVYNRYFVSLIVQLPDYNIEHHTYKPNNEGLGIDLGIRTYATIFNGYRTFTIHHPWKNKNGYRSRLQFYQQKINSLLSVVDYKQWCNEKRCQSIDDIYHSNNIEKLYIKIRKYYKKIHDYMDDFIKKLCNKLVVIAKPEWITIENLDIEDMLQDKHFSHKFHDRIHKSNWYKFKEFLIQIAYQYGCKVYQADKYYPSTRICHICGFKNKKTSKEYISCKNCGEIYNRDENAAINLFRLNRENKSQFLYPDFLI